MSKSSEDIYQIKVTLLETKPPIWRRLLVPASMTLEQLHHALQAAMGWDDCHLHEFSIGRKRFGQPESTDGLMDSSTGNESTVRMFDVLGKVGAKAVYTYDFGDGWEHGIAVEKVLAREPKVVYPICTDGKLNGPPEDCGGVPGYYNLLKAIRDPKHEEHEEMLDWIGEGFDPNEFPVEGINERLESCRGGVTDE